MILETPQNVYWGIGVVEHPVKLYFDELYFHPDDIAGTERLTDSFSALEFFFSTAVIVNINFAGKHLNIPLKSE